MATIEKYQTSTGTTRYMVRYRTPQHTQTKKRGFTTKRAAEAFANTVEVEKLTGNYVAPSLGQVTVGELGKEWLARQAHHKASWSARLESVWRVHVEPRWGRRRIADIRPTEVQKWVAEMKLSPSSVAHAQTVLAGILDDAVADRRLATNPARGVKLPRKTTTKPRSFLTAAQVHSLADESKHPDIVLLLATTGLRWGEMAALRVRDIDLGRGRIRVERSASKVNSKTIIGTTKTHAARSVAVSASVSSCSLRRWSASLPTNCCGAGAMGSHCGPQRRRTGLVRRSNGARRRIRSSLGSPSMNCGTRRRH